MSELKRYLDRLANGPLLDSVVSPGRYVKDIGFGELMPEKPLDETKLSKRRIAVRDAAANAAPLKMRKTRGKAK